MNPLEMVYDTLWSMAFASAELSALVKPGNRVRYDRGALNKRDPLREQVSNADLPEIVLVSTSTAANLMETSHTTRLTRSYDWIISSGEMPNNKLSEVEWALMCAMVDWPAHLCALRWPDDSWQFVKRHSVTSVNSGFADPQRNRGVRGWSSVWSIEVEMHFKTSDLRASISPTTTTTTTTTV